MSRPAARRVIINGRFLTQPGTGVQRFAVEISRRLRQQDHDVEVLCPRGALQSRLAAELGARAVGRTSGQRWEQFELPLHARGTVLLSLTNTGPLAHRRHIVALHDAATFAYPEAYSPAFRTWYRVLQPLLGRAAVRVLTVSEFSRGEIMRRIGVPARKIVIVSESGEHLRHAPVETLPVTDPPLIAGSYVLAVSSMNPTKNFAAFIRAAGQLPDISFVVAGGTNDRIFAAAGLDTTSMTRVGYVTDGQLRALYENAACFVFPSVYEGFGLPPLEAMSVGCPVVAARAASIPEVCGDAAVYVDPTSESDLANVLRRIVGSSEEQEDLRTRGLERAAMWTWAAAAQQVQTVIDEVS